MVKLIGDIDNDEHGIRAGILATAQLVIIDEAHRAAAPSFRAILDAFGDVESDTRIIGLTATPFRAEYLPADETSGTRELKQIFKKIIEPMKTLGANPRIKLQQRGFLAIPM